MLRLIKYLKPFLLLILLTIVFLFGQANADLALPDYLSKIVNNGIQQGGVENAVPEAIRQSEMEKLTLFMTSEEQALVLDAYTLVEPDSPEASQYVEQYPALETEAIYVLKELDRRRDGGAESHHGQGVRCGRRDRTDDGRSNAGPGAVAEAWDRPLSDPAWHRSLHAPGNAAARAAGNHHHGHPEAGSRAWATA